MLDMCVCELLQRLYAERRRKERELMVLTAVHAVLLGVSLYRSAVLVSTLTAVVVCVGVAVGGARQSLLTYFQVI